MNEVIKAMADTLGIVLDAISDDPGLSELTRLKALNAAEFMRELARRLDDE